MIKINNANALKRNSICGLVSESCWLMRSNRKKAENSPLSSLSQIPNSRYTIGESSQGRRTHRYKGRIYGIYARIRKSA